MDVETEIDRLYQVPLTEFTSARNSLASKLKRAGKAKDANRVKALAKPSVSAWAVNQIYWKHRKEFDRLIRAGEEFRTAQAAQMAGNTADARKAGEARQDAISALSRLAADVLQNGEHSPSPETMRRISTTFEAISAYATVPGAASPGRLSEDVEAPGFDALTALLSGHLPKRASTTGEAPQKASKESAAAKASIRKAQEALHQAETRARDVELRLKKADGELQQAERRRAEAEEHYLEIAKDSKEAAKAVSDARHELERAQERL